MTMRIMVRMLCFLLFFVGAMVFLASVNGCQTIYRAVGLTPAQAEIQSAKDANSITQFVDNTRDTFWPIANAAVAGLATVISGYLGVMLKKEKAISKSVIAGVELGGDDATKQSVFLASTMAGNASNVAKRVQDITGSGNMPTVTIQQKTETVNNG